MNEILKIREINKQIKKQQMLYIDPLKKELDNEYTALFNTFKGKAFLLNTRTYDDKKWRHYYYFIDKHSTTMCDGINFRICDIKEDNKIQDNNIPAHPFIWSSNAAIQNPNNVVVCSTPVTSSSAFASSWSFKIPQYNGFEKLTTINNKLCEEREWTRRFNILSVYNKIKNGGFEETEEIKEFIKYYNIREHL